LDGILGGSESIQWNYVFFGDIAFFRERSGCIVGQAAAIHRDCLQARRHALRSHEEMITVIRDLDRSSVSGGLIMVLTWGSVQIQADQ
jgi:hypothetical protein